MGNGSIGGGPGVLATLTTAEANPDPGTLSLDLGTALERGYNTITGNDPAPGPGFQVGLIQGDQPFSNLTVPALGNWWGSVDPAAIESLVVHQVDDPGLAFVDFGGPLSDPLPLRTTPDKVPVQGGQLVSVGFDPPGGGFCALPGQGVSVTLDGTPVLVPTFAPDGQSLTFLSPPLPGRGQVNLVVSNPAGQTGVLSMSAVPGEPARSMDSFGAATTWAARI